MKNITVTVQDETYREARVCAAKQDTTVSALVRQFLESLPEHSYAGLDPSWDGLDDELDPDEGYPSPPISCETVKL